MVNNAILETTLMRLAINFGKFFKKGEKECYTNLFQEYFPHISDDDWIRAVEAYIRDTNHKGMPKVSDLQAVLPQKQISESTHCNACHKGLRSIAEKSQSEYWHAVTYACTCEAGKRYTSFASWQCNSCKALEPFSNQTYEETQQMNIPICRAYDHHPYEVNCLRWKKRLADETESPVRTGKPLNESRIPQSIPDIEEAQIPF